MTETELLVAGVELGGTKCVAVLVRDGKILARETCPTRDPVATLGTRPGGWRAGVVRTTSRRLASRASARCSSTRSAFDGDRTLSIVISKAMLLAADDKLRTRSSWRSFSAGRALPVSLRQGTIRDGQLMKRILVRLALASALGFGIPAIAAAQLPAFAPAPFVQTERQAIAQDAAQYALRYRVDPAEAASRLRAQEESVAETDRIAERYRDRLAGISIEHAPGYRIVVLLTGSSPVAPRVIRAGGLDVPVSFRTGAAATRTQLAAAIVTYRAAIREIVPRSQGVGVDMRTGELVVVAESAFDPYEAALIEADLSDLTGVPVRVRALEGADANFAADGGSRVEGIDPRDGRRYACTTGFVVTDAVRTGVVTAAHCPDTLTAYDQAGTATSLEFVGQWGVGFQDVQVHVAATPGQPLFYADTATGSARRPTAARSRTSTRAGDAVCHRGEATGYSCSEVELVDYAPGGALCAGPCDPVWTTVAGPTCRGGDSGGPIFSGTVAFGIAKGGSYAPSGKCGFYFYMSTDFLPDGWRLLLDEAAVPRR